MARPLRIEYEGAFYHLTARGNEKKAIFRDDNDRKVFFEYLKEQVLRYDIKVYCYCLMGNHYHLLIETPYGNLAKVMQILQTSYTVYFNRRHNRVGHLFQGRYNARLVQADAYLHRLSRYIHLNPVRAGIVNNPAAYSWSSYKYFISETESLNWLNPLYILEMFDEKIGRSKKMYKEFVEQGINDDNDLREKMKNKTIIANEEFKAWIRKKFLEQKEDREITDLKYMKCTNLTLEEIRSEVAEEVEIDKLARKISIYLARKHTSLKLDEIADYFGKRTYSSISQMYSRMKSLRKKDKGIDGIISKIEKNLNVKI